MSAPGDSPEWPPPGMPWIGRALRHLVWGATAALAAFGCLLASMIATGAGAYWLRIKWLPVQTPRPAPELFVAGDIGAALALSALLGPLVLAGAVAAARARWQWGLLAGLGIGPLAGAVAYCEAGEPEWAIALPPAWAVAGLIGGAISWGRRRSGS